MQSPNNFERIAQSDYLACSNSARSVVPPLVMNDLFEHFISGSGSGYGQSHINSDSLRELLNSRVPHLRVVPFDARWEAMQSIPPDFPVCLSISLLFP